jgi:hypothetical protein
MKLITLFWMISLSTLLACASESKPKAPEDGAKEGAEEDHDDHDEDDKDGENPGSPQNDGDDRQDQDGDDPDDANDPGGSDDATLSCEQQWDRYVAANKVGRKEAYEITSSGGASIYLVEVKTISRLEVLESSDEQVVVKTTYEDQSSEPVTKNHTTTKSGFIASCNDAKQNRPDDGNKPDDAQFEQSKLAERNESKSVRAGEFDCKYLKMQYEMSSGDSRSVDVIESWTSTEHDVVVYQVSKTTFTFEGDEQEVTSTSELIEFEPGG